VTAFQDELKEHGVLLEWLNPFSSKNYTKTGLAKEVWRIPDKKGRDDTPEFLVRQHINSGRIEGGKKINNPA
jgi:hypothetical protein